MDIVVVGHLSRDLLVTSETAREALGGGTAYAMLAPSLGISKCGIVSCVGGDFDEEYMRALVKSGLDMTGVSRDGQHTTRFVNQYDSNGVRTQRVEAIAAPIRKNALLECHLQSRVIHFCPLIGEIDISCIKAAKEAGALVSLDPQGFLRAVQGDRVVPQKWADRAAVLEHVDVLKLDEDELQSAVGIDTEIDAVGKILNEGPEIVIVTRARRGSTIHTQDSRIDIPLVLADQLVDATGSGDTYVIGFLVEYIKNENLRRAGVFGASCASFNLETMGPYDMPTRKQVESRMKSYV
ncbi:MAG: carbohydrate kinase family protein [Candidatus Thorarchaeota archaeon]|nr:carbohydrate kinase family protein [Candidatus Thorarchaeota archaeon]